MKKSTFVMLVGGMLLRLYHQAFMKRILFAVLLVAFSVQNAVSQSLKAVETSTDIAMFAPAVLGVGVAFAKSDDNACWQLGKTLALQVATCYALKYTVDKERPDCSDNHSFPSNHTGFAFAGATFLQQRYGWRVGVPAYLVSGYVAWGRVYSKRHDVWDVLAGAAIGVGSGLLFTTPYAKEHGMVLAPTATPNGGCVLYFSMSL